MRARAILACVALAAFATTVPGTSAVAAGNGGFRTKQAAMLTRVMQGVSITPILTVNDELPGGYTFESIPDGISVRPRGSGRVDLYVNHETSKVPFPWGPALVPSQPATNASSQSDFDNAQVSRLSLNAGARVLDGSFAIGSSEGFQRFCSNYLATSKEGFDSPILFTNEESPDYALRQEDSWPPALNDPNQEENGVVVALDPATGNHQTIYGMGRHNHENDVAIPGYDDLVVMSGDDTFTSGSINIPAGGPAPEGSRPSQSELYSYIAADTDELLDDGGDLWAFVSDDPNVNDYYDFAPGSTQSVNGHFIEVPKNIATGRINGHDIRAADVGYPAPDGGWQSDLRVAPASLPIDGPQWVLQYWAATNNVFEFVRVEDLAYDKRPGMSNVVYFADTGRATAGASQLGRSTNGRIWKMVLDPDDPTQVDSLSILLDGDDNPVQTLGEIHQPDNLESTKTGLLVTEDPGGNNQFSATSTDPNATSARLWYVSYAGVPQVVAKVDQSADGGPTDVGPAPTGDLSIGNVGAWESSGIVDASAAFGAGAFLVDVQAHTLWVEKKDGPDNFAPSGPDSTFKREGGQLLLIRIPGI